METCGQAQRNARQLACSSPWLPLLGPGRYRKPNLVEFYPTNCELVDQAIMVARLCEDGQAILMSLALKLLTRHKSRKLESRVRAAALALKCGVANCLPNRMGNEWGMTVYPIEWVTGERLGRDRGWGKGWEGVEGSVCVRQQGWREGAGNKEGQSEGRTREGRR